MLAKLLRLLVLLAVALTVPLQGLAAVTAGQCMALGHHGTDLQAAHDDHGAHDGHDGHDAQDQPSSDGDQKSAQQDDGHCAPCVACCGAAVISTASQSLIPDSAAASAIAVSGKSFSGIAPESLDRPPLAL